MESEMDYKTLLEEIGDAELDLTSEAWSNKATIPDEIYYTVWANDTYYTIDIKGSDCPFVERYSDKGKTFRDLGNIPMVVGKKVKYYELTESENKFKEG
jgi:hypothetical protein